MDPKKPTCRISEPKNFPEGIKWYNAKNKNIRNSMFVFVSSSYHLRPPKKILAKFSFPKKFRNRKFRTAKRSFNLSRYLKSGVSPRSYLHSWHSSKCWLLFFVVWKERSDHFTKIQTTAQECKVFIWSRCITQIIVLV